MLVSHLAVDGWLTAPAPGMNVPPIPEDSHDLGLAALEGVGKKMQYLGDQATVHTSSPQECA